ncbi:MAG: phosphocholine cytidylyltransferase family protein [Methanomassiliicoccaceae archaeon]|nr:phosphocholine cytidylyltransferase family protein [Methanomassiliicoccaceae archaeon]
MRAILMAAGVGSRMGKAVTKPKSTLKVGDTTIIAHTVDMLIANSIDVSVVVGYRKEMIYEALSGRKVRFFFNPFYRATNSSASLWFARELIDGSDDVIFINADIYWEQSILEILLSDKRDAVMLGDESRADNGDFFLNTVSGRVTAYGKDLKREERNTESVGIAKVSKNFSLTFRKWLEAHIENENYGTLWEGIFCLNSAETPIHVADVGGWFQAEVDTADDYERVKEYVSKKRKDAV